MSIKKKSLVLHLDALAVIEELSLQQRGELLTAIFNHHVSEDKKLPLELDQLLKIVFLPFKNQFDRDLEKYIKTCETNKEIANSRKDRNKRNVTERNESLEVVEKEEEKVEEVKTEPENNEPETSEEKIEVPEIFGSDKDKESDTDKNSKPDKKEIKKPVLNGKWFLELFNSIKKEKRPMSTGTKTLTTTAKNNLEKLLKSGYVESDFIGAINEMFKSNWVIQSGNDIPEHVLREGNFQRYHNKYINSGEVINSNNTGEPNFIDE